MTCGLMIPEGISSRVIPAPLNPDLPGQWHLLHTKSRQEKALIESLAGMEIPCYLPLIRSNRNWNGRKASIELPMFPGYVFLKGSIDQAYEADRTRRVVQIIRVTDQDRIAWELRQIALALNSEVKLDPYPYLSKGIKVEVRSGPLRGLQGVIENKTSRDRLILQVNVLGQASSLEIDGALLEPIE